MKKYSLLIILVILAASLIIAAPVFAIANPDSSPTIVNKWVWRNVLTTNDKLVILETNIPYSVTPAVACSEAFVWRLLGTDGTTPLGEALTYDFNDSGYGYNVVGFYFYPTDNFTWATNYYIELSGTPSAFTTPPTYVYQLTSSDFSSLTDEEDVEDDIETKILSVANSLDAQWALGVTYSLLEESELHTVLSTYGEAFFRGALYGVQGYAPDVFRIIFNNIDDSVLTNRTWTDAYSGNLSSSNNTGNIGTGMQAGNDLLDVDYNLFGLLLTLGAIAGVTIVGLVISGDWWGSISGGIGPMIIFTRMGLFGMGELALIAALGWLFLSAKVWKLI